MGDFHNKLAFTIAGKILFLQEKWACWMNNCFERLSPKGRLIVLASIGLIVITWCILRITGSQQTVAQSSWQPHPSDQSKQLDMIPTDSIRMMEEIYKSYQKTR